MIPQQDVKSYAARMSDVKASTSIIGKHICELNNRPRAKEARPEDFVDNPQRLNMKSGFSRGTGVISYI